MARTVNIEGKKAAYTLASILLVIAFLVGCVPPPAPPPPAPPPAPSPPSGQTAEPPPAPTPTPTPIPPTSTPTATPTPTPLDSCFLEAPAEVRPGDSITVRARLSRKGQYFLRIAKRFPTKEGTGAWFKNIGIASSDNNLIASWYFTMPYLEAGTYGLEILPEEGDRRKVILNQNLQVKKVVGTLPVSILPRSPGGLPEVVKQYITPSDPKVKAAVQDILSGEWRWAYDDFEALRQWVWAHVSCRSDKEIHGVSNYWQLPAETLELGTGDCEDFAILLCTLLRAYGVSADDVYVAIGCAKEGSGCHGYLLERYYRGTWRVLEPQAELISTLLVFNRDVFTDLTYEERYCFNDQDYFTGAPTLPPGTYEFEVGHSSWPVTRGASVVLQRQLSVAEQISGTVEWLQQYGDNPNIVYDWTLNVYDPDNDIVFTWSGTDKGFMFSFVPTEPGIYKIEILKRDYMPRCVRLTINPLDWRRR